MKIIFTVIIVLTTLVVNNGAHPRPEGGTSEGGTPKDCLPKDITLDHYHPEPRTSINIINGT